MPKVRKHKITASLTTIVERENSLKETVKSLLPQVNKLNVYLHGYVKMPQFLKNPKIEVAFDIEHGDRGDIDKLAWIDEVKGYHLVCFKSGTLVETKVGAKKIEDIEIGELVKTHTGSFRKVLKTFKNQLSENSEIYHIKTSNSVIKCTPEHPFYVLRNGFHRWIEAKNLLLGDSLLYPSNDKANYLKFDCFSHPLTEQKKGVHLGSRGRITSSFKGKHLGYFKTIKEAEIAYMKAKKSSSQYFGDYLIDIDFARFMGLYLAEGCGGHDSIRFTFNNNEVEYHNFIINFCIKRFGRKPTVHKRWATTIKLNIRSFSDKFTEWFGKEASVKRIPKFVFDWNIQNKLAFLKGYIEGDGTTDIKGRSISVGSVSKELIDDIEKLCNESGIKINKKYSYPAKKGIIVGREVNTKDSYVLTFDKKGWYKILDIVEAKRVGNYLTLPVIGLESKNFQLQYPLKDHLSNYVFNLEVEKDNSYIVESVAVHNCDDDLIYPKDYAKKMVEAIERYNRKAIVSFHGTVVNRLPIATYYQDRGVYPCLRLIYLELE